MAFNWSAFGTDSHEREIKVHYVPFTDGKTIDIVLDFMLREDRIFGIDLERKPGMYGPPYPDHIALIQICSPKRCLLIHRTTEMVDTASATTLLRDFFCHPEKTSNPERILIFDGVKNDVPYFRSNFGWKVDAEHARIYSIDDAKWPKWFKVEKRNRLENVLNLITDKLVVGHWGTSFLPHRFVAKDKTISLSAWHRDHLSERQLDYAIFDAWRLAVSWAIVEEHYPQARFKPPSNRSVRVFTCPCCRERFSERTRLGEHLQTEHPDYPALDLSEYCRHTGRLRIPGARRPLLGQPLNQPAAASTPTPAPALTPDGPAPPQSPSETKEEEEEEEPAASRGPWGAQPGIGEAVRRTVTATAAAAAAAGQKHAREGDEKEKEEEKEEEEEGSQGKRARVDDAAEHDTESSEEEEQAASTPTPTPSPPEETAYEPYDMPEELRKKIFMRLIFKGRGPRGSRPRTAQQVRGEGSRWAEKMRRTWRPQQRKRMSKEEKLQKRARKERPEKKTKEDWEALSPEELQANQVRRREGRKEHRREKKAGKKEERQRALQARRRAAQERDRKFAEKMAERKGKAKGKNEEVTKKSA